MSAISASQARQIVDMVCWRPKSYSLCVGNYSEPAVRCHRHGEHKYFWRFLLFVWSVFEVDWSRSIIIETVTSFMHRLHPLYPTTYYTPLEMTFAGTVWRKLHNECHHYKATSFPEELRTCMLENSGIYVSQIADKSSYDYSTLQRCNAV